MLKKLLFVALAMGFVNNIFADENTIDFKAITPQNSTYLNQSNTSQSSYKSTKIGDFEFEFGIGYIMSQFKAEQDWGGATASSSATGHGADIYFNGSYYVGESFGVMIGLGTELINIDWDEPLYTLFCMYICDLDTNSNDFLGNMYLNFGAFKNVWQNNKSSLRIFGNLGLSVNWLGGSYERTISCSTSSCQTTLETGQAVSFPISVGLRYMFVENHGLELVSKYDLTKWDYSTKTPADVPSFNTTISRNLSIALRYVYKFD